MRYHVPLASRRGLRTYTLGGYKVSEVNPTPAIAVLMPQAVVGCSGVNF